MIMAGRLLAAIVSLVGAAALLAGCVEFNDPTATPAPLPTATPVNTPTIAIVNTGSPEPSPTVVVDVLKLVPDGYQPLSVQRADLAGDGILEWIVLAGKPGQPTFETVQPFVMGVEDGQASVLWRGQSDFSLRTGGDLHVQDLTGDGKPEIIYQNTTDLGGAYAFVYGGSANVKDHPLLTPVGGPLDSVGFFAGWQLDFLPAGQDGRVPISSVTDLAGTRWVYRWDGSVFRAAESLQGTPFPTGIAVAQPTPPDPTTVDVTHDLSGVTIIDKIVGDLDGDGMPEISALYQQSGSSQLQIAIYSYGAVPGFNPYYRIVWSSGPLAGTEDQVFKLRDLTGDGKPELLSGQGGGTAGAGTLYTVAYANGAYGLVKAVSGHFDGLDHLGEDDYSVRELGTGQAPEVSAIYGGGAKTDVYQWASGVFKFLRSQ